MYHFWGLLLLEYRFLFSPCLVHDNGVIREIVLMLGEGRGSVSDGRLAQFVTGDRVTAFHCNDRLLVVQPLAPLVRDSTTNPFLLFLFSICLDWQRVGID